MLLGFTIYAVAMSLNPPPEPTACGCGGSDAVVESWIPIVLRNAQLAAGSALLTLSFLAMERHSPRPQIEAAATVCSLRELVG